MRELACHAGQSFPPRYHLEPAHHCQFIGNEDVMPGRTTWITMKRTRRVPAIMTMALSAITVDLTSAFALAGHGMASKCPAAGQRQVTGGVAKSS